MKKVIDSIVKIADSNYKSHINGIVCDIFSAYQIEGMSSVLSVAPIGFNDANAVVQNPVRYNVIPIGSAGVYGFPTALKEAYYAYVLTDDVSKIEGKPAIIIPKSVLFSNPGPDWATENNMISAMNINNMVVRKDNLIVSSKYA